MDIIVKGADFSASAIFKIGRGTLIDNVGKYVTEEGNISNSASFAVSSAIPITSDMRKNGILVKNCKASSSIPALVFLTNSEISSSNFLKYFRNDKEGHDAYIPADEIPSNATHIVANGYSNKSSIVYSSYLMNVADIVISNGYMATDGSFVTDTNYKSTNRIPVYENISYHLRALYISTFNKDGGFIERISLSQVASGVMNNYSFGSNVDSVRLTTDAGKMPFIKF